MEDMTISTEFVLGVFLGVFIPTFLWAIKMFAMTKKLLNMHLEADEFGFGTVKIKELLEANLDTQDQMARDRIESNKGLRYAIKELTHFMQWMVKESTGKEAPPYVRGDD